MTSIKFTKMHGLGNDYVYIDCVSQQISDPEGLAVQMSDRHFGVGGDGLVLILPSDTADFRMRMFNADGSEAEMCGNAVRCVARYLFERGHTSSKAIRLETGRGVLLLELTTVAIQGNARVETVRVNLGEPILQSSLVPVESHSDRVISEPLEVSGESWSVTCVSMGNPHAVIFVDEITDRHVLDVGPKIEVHPRFPARTNVEFVRIKSRDSVDMRVWERGTGETLACGTGAAAVVVAGNLNGFLDTTVEVALPGGILKNEWLGEGNSVYQTGPAAFVFDGVYGVPSE